MIQLRGVKKIYRAPDGNSVEALSGIDLDIGDGEIFGIIGLSGAGKSTLLRTVNRLEEPSSGKIFIDGREITALDAGGLRLARRKIGMIFQHFNLLASRTVTGNVAFPLELERWKPKDVKDRVAEMLDRPHVLLSDEATSALDPRTTKSILSLLAGINRLMGLTIVVVTHEMNVIREICSRVAIIEAGRIVEQGTVKEIFLNPRSKTAREFLAKLPRTGYDEGAGLPILAGAIDSLYVSRVGTLTVQFGGAPQVIAAAMDMIRAHNVKVEVIWNG